MEKKRLLALVAFAVLLIFFAGWYLGQRGGSAASSGIEVQSGAPTSDAAEEKVADEAGDKTEAPSTIWVYVVGEVDHPGVLQLPAGSRMFQAVEMAAPGAKADVSQLDMARALTDGEKIRVPRLGEKLEPEPAAGSGGATNGSAGGSKLTNINTASLQELDQNLPGIGPALAQRIVDYRSQHPFRSKEELKEVSGIGDKKYEALKDLITVGP